MPHINFNVPFLNESGEPVMQIKTDQNKLKIGANGHPHAAPIVDADGNVEQEPVSIRNLLVRILSNGFPGDENISFADKAKRGKLARKIQNNSSTHYTDTEISIVTDLSAKAGSTSLVTQLDDLISGVVAESA